MKFFVRKPSGFRKTMVSKKFLNVRWAEKDEVSRFPLEKMLSHITENLGKETLRCFKKFRVSKSFVHKCGVSQFSVDYFLSHSTGEFRKENLLCFRNLLIPKNVREKRRVSRFSSNVFCLLVTNQFETDPFMI